jgi:hypothetical protein
MHQQSFGAMHRSRHSLGGVEPRLDGRERGCGRDSGRVGPLRRLPNWHFLLGDLKLGRLPFWHDVWSIQPQAGSKTLAFV